MAGYTRQSTYIDGDVITADHSNDEFDELVAAFSNTTGHAHDGTAAEGPVIGLIGDAGLATPLNKIVVDTANDQIEFNIDVSGTSTEQIVVKDGVIEPTTDDDIDLGSSSKEFKDLYLDGTANIDTLVVGTSTGVTSVDTDLTSVSASDDTLASAKAIKTYVDAQVTAQDLDFQGDTGGALNIDLDSETLTVAGGTGIDTSGAGNTLTVAIDSTVATLTDAQTLTNKTLTTPTISSITNTGTITLPTSTDTLVGRDTTDTLTNKTLTSAVLNGTISGTSIKDEDDLSSDSASHLATQQSIKAYVDSQITANNEIGELTDVTITTVADNEVLAYDSTSSEWINQTAAEAGLATLTGTETLTNKTLTTPTIDLSGVTSSGDLAVADGGTGASTATAARTNLGVAIGTDVQAYDAGLASIAGLTTAANKMLYATASDTYAVTDLTAFGRSIIDDADASAARTTLGLGTAATTASTDYATAAQGALADSALQSGDNVSVLTNDSGFITGNQTITLSGDATGTGTTAITVSLAANTVGVSELNLTDGTNGQVLTTDGAGTISFADAAGGGASAGFAVAMAIAL